ncbi:type II toxin-antitoxin system Phd/YefM family antitoxin [Actinoplanes sp. NPDC051343]|uniref:type II toxin-antitoxin system Phd/YefM family antitoxin n=1 Tax=Actinoplanes sp. NPDC051343 TaxID=3363906 RepID=UPI00379B8AAB
MGLETSSAVASAMRTVNFTQLRQNLAAELDSVTDDAEELVVTRSGHEPVVIVPLANDLIAEIMRNGYIGKPEALRGELSGHYGNR